MSLEQELDLTDFDDILQQFAENLNFDELTDEELVEEEAGMQWDSIEDVWPDYPTKDDFFFNEEEY